MRQAVRSLLAAALGLALCGASTLAADPPQAGASLRGLDGKAVGEATFVQGPTGVLIRLELRGVAPGPHGLHLHAVGRCEAADKFQSAGSHIGADGVMHGLLAEEGPHAGDLPNVNVREDGTASVELFTTYVTLRDDEGTFRLLDEDGSALVLHAKADDQMTQPGGGTGDRIACGLLAATE